MNDKNQAQSQTVSRSHRQWFVDVVLLLFGAGGFTMWFFLATLLTWAVVTAITDRSYLAIPDPTIRQITTVLLQPISLFGKTRPIPALPTLCINAALFCFNMLAGWRWIKASRSGRFALLLLGEFFIVVCAVFALALHIAASPWARNPTGLGF